MAQAGWHEAVAVVGLGTGTERIKLGRFSDTRICSAVKAFIEHCYFAAFRQSKG